MGLRFLTCSLPSILPRRWRARSDEEQTVHRSTTVYQAADSAPKLAMMFSRDCLQWSSDINTLFVKSRDSSGSSRISFALSTAANTTAGDTTAGDTTAGDTTAAEAGTPATSPTLNGFPIHRPIIPELAGLPSDVMSVETLRQVVDSIAVQFDPCPYAVVGGAAMVYYGYTGRKEHNVVIHCPTRAMASVIQWTLKLGVREDLADHRVFGIRTNDGKNRQVDIIYAKDFDELDIVHIGPAPVVSIPCLLNDKAKRYPMSFDDAERAEFEREIRWLLHKSIELGTPEQRLTRERAAFVVDQWFWDTYTGRFPETIPLFARAGLDVRAGKVV